MIDSGDTTYAVTCPAGQNPQPNRHCSSRVGWVTMPTIMSKWSLVVNN